MNISPINDHVLVELTKNDSTIVVADSGESITRGKVIAVPDETYYISGNGWVNFADSGTSTELYTYTELLGKTVFFRKYADQDCTIRQGDKSYALIKLTDLMGVENE